MNAKQLELDLGPIAPGKMVGRPIDGPTLSALRQVVNMRRRQKESK